MQKNAIQWLLIHTKPQAHVAQGTSHIESIQWTMSKNHCLNETNNKLNIHRTDFPLKSPLKSAWHLTNIMELKSN